jgi:predicted small integral membrane protein
MIAFQIFYAVFFMHVWFDTDALVEYSKLLRLKKAFRIDSWEEYRTINPRIGYLEYLRIKHTSFFVRLITCRPCLLAWVSIALAAAFGMIFWFPVTYVGAYAIYNLLCRLKRY